MQAHQDRLADIRLSDHYRQMLFPAIRRAEGYNAGVFGIRQRHARRGDPGQAPGAFLDVVLNVRNAD